MPREKKKIEKELLNEDGSSECAVTSVHKTRQGVYRHHRDRIGQAENNGRHASTSDEPEVRKWCKNKRRAQTLDPRHDAADE